MGNVILVLSGEHHCSLHLSVSLPSSYYHSFPPPNLLTLTSSPTLPAFPFSLSLLLFAPSFLPFFYYPFLYTLLFLLSNLFHSINSFLISFFFCSFSSTLLFISSSFASSHYHFLPNTRFYLPSPSVNP